MSSSIQSVSTVASTRWLSLQTLQYSDPSGKIRSWDLVSRTTKKHTETSDSSLATDAVIILPILRNSDGSMDTILVEQFRPPVRCVTLEFPAGLVDANESIEQAALRELYEETGYVGQPSSCNILSVRSNGLVVVPPYGTSPPLCMSPGLADEVVQVVVVEVDCSLPENINPQQHLDEGEYVHFRRVPLSSGLRYLIEQDSDNGPMPIMGLYLFALGLELGSQMKAHHHDTP